MSASINDSDIETFLRRNAAAYPSQIGLIQAAVRLLWPEGAPAGGAERVVRACLRSSMPLADREPPSSLLPARPR